MKEVWKMKLRKEELREVFEWASKQKDKKNRSLLQRARDSLLTGSYWRYNTIVWRDGKTLKYECDCEWAKRRREACKHVIAYLILANEETLKNSKKWRKFFEEYYAKVEEVLKVFDRF